MSKKISPKQVFYVSRLSAFENRKFLYLVSVVRCKESKNRQSPPIFMILHISVYIHFWDEIVFSEIWENLNISIILNIMQKKEQITI